jgi:hypothetical protein
MERVASDVITPNNMLRHVSYRKESTNSDAKHYVSSIMIIIKPTPSSKTAFHKTFLLSSSSFDETYKLAVATLAEHYKASDELISAMHATLPSFKRFYGIQCTLETIASEKVKYTVDKKRDFNKPEYPYHLLREHPEDLVSKIFRQDGMLSRVVFTASFEGENQNKPACIQITVNNEDGTRKLGYFYLNPEKDVGVAYMAAIAAICAKYSVQLDSDIHRAMVNTLPYFIDMYGIEAIRTPIITERWITTSAEERSQFSYGMSM